MNSKLLDKFPKEFLIKILGTSAKSVGGSHKDVFERTLAEIVEKRLEELPMKLLEKIPMELLEEL